MRFFIKIVTIRTIKRTMKTINRILFAVCLLLTGSLYFSPAWAEGSRSLYPSDYSTSGFRANLDIQPSQSYVGKVKRFTFLYVYAQANEYILLGSRNRNNGGDIYIYNPQDFGIPGNETIPGTKNFTCSSTSPPVGSYGGTGKGIITNRAQELAGPKSADGTAPSGGDTFVPCAYKAPSTGIYGVEFTVATSGGSGPNGVIDPPNIGSNSVSAWDVTVRASATSTTDIDGRVFTYAWAAFTGLNDRPVFSTHYYVTSDGYRYSETLGGLDPNGYALYANSLGFLDNGQPLYKDLRASGTGTQTEFAQIVPKLLPPGVTTQIAQYPFFFSDVSPSGTNNTEVERVLTALNIPLTPPSPTVSSVSFTGHVPVTLHSTTGAGGVFSFSTTDTITYQIVISRNGSDFSPENTNNAVLTGIAATGSHTVTWDGEDQTGANFPSSNTAYPFRVYGRAGEVHFPIIDAENNGNGATKAAATFGGGPTITRLNGTNPGDKTVYFDDRGYITSSGTLVGVLNGTLCNTGTPAGPSPNVSLDGVDSTLNYTSDSLYRWWVPGSTPNANADCTSTAGWGDAKGLNLWAYYSTEPQTNNLYIDPVTYDGATSVSAPTTATAGSTVQGAFTFANNGTGTATGVTYAMDIGTGCTPSITFNNLPTGASAGSCSVVSGKGRYIFTGMPASLTAGQAVVGATATTPMTFSYTAPATGPVVVTTTIAISEADDYAGNNSDTASTGIGTNDVQTTVSVPATANAGATVAGNFQFANYGATAAAGWTYTATIGSAGSCPSGVTFTSLPTGVTLNNYNTSTCAATFTGLPTNLAAGQSFNFGFSYTAPLLSGTVPVNTTVSATGDANATNNASNGSTTIAANTFTISGTVFNDNGQPTGTAGNGLQDGTETGTNAGGLYALLVNGSGNVVASTTVTTNTGAFSFSGIANGDYTVRLSTAAGTVGNAAPAASLPGGWINTGESINGTSTDGSANGDLAITIASADLTTLSLGIRQAVPDVYTTVEAPASVAAGDPVTTLLTFGNQGDAPAEGVTYAVTLPAGLTGLSCAGATCSYDPATGLLTLTGLPTSLIPGQTEQVVVTYTAPGSGPLAVTAVIATTTAGETPTPNNTGAASTTVSSSVVDVAAWLNAPAEAVTGSTVTVPVNFTNLGGVQATGVTYTLTLPTGLTNVACTGSGISCSYAGTTVTITGLPVSLDPSQTVGLTLSYTAPASASSPVTVTATVNAASDSNAGNNSADGSTVINATATAPDVISTVAPPATATAGNTVTVPVTYANLGPDAATVTRYELDLSDALTNTDGSIEIRNNGALCVYTAGTGAITGCNLPGSLNPGQAVDLTLTYTAPASGAVTVTSNITATGETNLANNPSTGSTTVSAVSVPDVYTTVDVPATVPAGGTVQALLTFGNQGLAAAGGVSYAVTLPPNLSGVSCSGATCTYDNATGVLTLTGLPTSLSPGQSEVVQLSYIAPASGSVTVQAQIATTTAGETPTNNNAAQASTTVTGSATADVTTWIDAPATANSGQTVNVLAGFTNLGAANATGVTYTLTLPTGATVSYNGAACTYSGGLVTGCGLPSTLTPGQTVELVAGYTAPASGPVTVTSTVAATNDSDAGNNSASTSTAITATAQADVATTVAPPPTAPAGSTVTVPITYANLGPAPAAGMGYTLTGAPSGATVSYQGTPCTYSGGAITGCGLPTTLAPGQTLDLTLSYTAPANGTVSVTSTVSTTTSEGGHTTNNSASGSTTITTAPTVDVYALVDAPATAVASSIVNVALTFGNQGNSTAAGVTYSALLPAGLSGVSCTTANVTCTYDSASGLVTITGIGLPSSLANSATATATLTYTAPATTGAVPVTARISATADPGFGGNNSASDSTVITAAPSAFTISGTVFNDNGQPTGTAGNGLKDGTETGTNAGGLYALLVNGSGDVVAHASVAANGAFSFSSIVAGDYTVRLSSVDASSGAAPAASLPVGWMNTGESINGTSTDGTADGDLAITVASADRTTLTLGIRQAVPDVYTTVEAPPSVAAGDSVTTLLTFGNQGAATAESVTYAVTLPQNLTGLSCTGATCDYNPTTGALTITGLPTILMSGQTEQVLVHYTAPGSGPLAVVSVIATTTAGETPTPNNRAEASTTVSSSVVDVAAWLNAPAEATTGSTVTVPVNFTNLGGTQATGVTYTLTLPTGLTNVACTGSGISCSYASGTGVVTITGLPGSLDPGQTVGLTLSYTAPVSTSSPVTVTTTVNATSDSNAGNNSASGSTVINATATAPDVISTVAPPATAVAGSTVTVPVTYANLGPDAATVTLYDLDLSDALTNTDGSIEIRNNGALCVYTAGTGAITGCNLPGSLNPGQAVDLTLTYTAPASGAVTVTSNITATGETNLANNPSTGSTTVSAVSVPDVYTTVDVPATVPAGGTVQALLTFGNQGLAAAGGVSYAVTLPPNLSGVSCSGATCTYDNATGVLTLTGLPTSLSPGQSEVVQLSYIAPASGSVTVQAQIATTTAGETPTNNNAAQASTRVTGSPTADVTTWIDAPATASSGQTVNVLAGFTNLGTANATSVTYTLTGLPAGATVSYNGAACTYTPGTGAVTGCGLPSTLTPGQTVELVASYTAPATGPVAVTSTVAATNDSDANNNSASDSTVITTTCTSRSTITGLIWHDTNRNGSRQQPDEGVLPGIVSLTPTGGSAAQIRIATANAQGEYRFENITAGEWTVEVEGSYQSDVLGFDPVGAFRETYTLAGCETKRFDVGFAAPPDNLGSVGDFVWFDQDSSGLVSEFYDSNGDGKLTKNAAGTEFSLADFEWVDLNNNNSADAGEYNRCGLRGVPVELLNAQGAVLDRTITGLRGGYDFTGLLLDKYSTRVNPTDTAIYVLAQEMAASGLCKPYPPPLVAARLGMVAAKAPLAAPVKQGVAAAAGAVLCGMTRAATQSTVLTTAQPSVDTLDYGLICGANIGSPNIFDPPSGRKTVNAAGLPVLEWRMVWINNSNYLADRVRVVDPIPAGMTYETDSLSCTLGSVASTVTTCTFDFANNRVVYEGTIAPDPGAQDEASAQNEVVITFRSRFRSGVTSANNTAQAYWDTDGDDDIDTSGPPVQTNNGAPVVYPGYGPGPASIPTLSPAALLGLITMLLWLLRSTTRARCAPLRGKRRDR